MAAYRMTPARRAALKKAQLASARKRKGHGRAKLKSVGRGRSSTRTRLKKAAKAVAVTAAAGAVVYGIHHHNKKTMSNMRRDTARDRVKTRRMSRDLHAAANRMKNGPHVPGFGDVFGPNRGKHKFDRRAVAKEKIHIAKKGTKGKTVHVGHAPNHVKYTSTHTPPGVRKAMAKAKLSAAAQGTHGTTVHVGHQARRRKQSANTRRKNRG